MLRKCLHTGVLLKKGFSPLDWKLERREWEFGEKRTELLGTGYCSLCAQSHLWFPLSCCSSAPRFSLVAGRDSPFLALLCQIANQFMCNFWGCKPHLLISLNNLLVRWSTDVRCPWFVELLHLKWRSCYYEHFTFTNPPNPKIKKTPKT